MRISGHILFGFLELQKKVARPFQPLPPPLFCGFPNLIILVKKGCQTLSAILIDVLPSLDMTLTPFSNPKIEMINQSNLFI